VLLGRQIKLLALREEQKLEVYENKALRMLPDVQK
jgi:hypothetical protein